MTERHIKRVRLGDVACEHSVRNRDGMWSSVYSVTNSRGFVASTDYFSKEVFSKDLTAYKRVEHGMFAYNPSRINVGSVACWRGKGIAVVSPLYVVFSVDEKIIYPCLLETFLHSSMALQQIKRLTSGSVRDSLKFSSFCKIELPLPPLAEQKRIAAVLDKISEMKRNAEARLQKLDLLVKARFNEMFGDVATNPMKWPMGKVADVAEFWNGLTYKPENISDNGTIVLRSSNIQSGELCFRDVVRVSVAAKDKNIVRKNDILMCSRNGSANLVGKTALIPELCERMYFGAFMMIVRCKDPMYLKAFFDSMAFRAQITCGKTATVNQITCSMMGNVRLPLPPLSLQRKFAAFVERIEALKVTVKKQLEQVDLLYRSRLQEYFS